MILEGHTVMKISASNLLPFIASSFQYVAPDLVDEIALLSSRHHSRIT